MGGGGTGRLLPGTGIVGVIGRFGAGGTGNNAGFSISGTGGNNDPAPGVAAPGRSGSVGSCNGMGMKPSSPVRILGF